MISFFFMPFALAHSLMIILTMNKEKSLTLSPSDGWREKFIFLLLHGGRKKVTLCCVVIVKCYWNFFLSSSHFTFHVNDVDLLTLLLFSRQFPSHIHHHKWFFPSARTSHEWGSFWLPFSSLAMWEIPNTLFRCFLCIVKYTHTRWGERKKKWSGGQRVCMGGNESLSVCISTISMIFFLQHKHILYSSRESCLGKRYRDRWENYFPSFFAACLKAFSSFFFFGKRFIRQSTSSGNEMTQRKTLHFNLGGFFFAISWYPFSISLHRPFSLSLGSTLCDIAAVKDRKISLRRSQMPMLVELNRLHFTMGLFTFHLFSPPPTLFVL